ncbi:MAG TPA: adenosylcobinamide-GDP ribazoletransferase, partial [Mesorhizobium sp.]
MTPRLSDVLVALVFFTRLPLPSFMSDRKLGEVIWAAPLVGLVVALLGAIVFALVDALDVPTLPAAAITLAAMMLLTGCLHEDGLADVADGFGGGKTIERKL